MVSMIRRNIHCSPALHAPKTEAMRGPIAVVVLTLFSSLPQPPQPSVPLYLRPEKAEPSPEIVGELGARDNDPSGISTWATKGLTRTCTPLGGCAGVSSATTVWTGFPGGYRPTKLTVFWKAATSMAMFGGTSQTRAYVEYSTPVNKAKTWTPVDQFVRNATQMTPAMSPATVTLPRPIDLAQLQVRGRLEVEMIGCPNEQCSAGTVNPSNVTGQIWISDIRVEIEEPALTASRAAVAKGETVTFRVEGAPGAQISHWTFTPEKGAELLRTDQHTAETWPLTVTESGTVSVTVRLRGQPQLNGRTFSLSRAVTMKPAVKPRKTK
jgi:hypothetical protein